MSNVDTDVRQIEFTWQHDCPFNNLTENHPHLNIRWVRPAIGVSESEVLGTFLADSEQKINSKNIITSLESQGSIWGIKEIEPNLFNVHLDRNILTLPPELLAECIHVNIEEHDGNEHWKVLTPSRRVEDYLFNKLNQTGKFNLNKILNIDASDSTEKQGLRELLTEKQYEAIYLGFQKGYFETPRQVTAEAIADELNITASSFLSRIRRGQRRLIENKLKERSMNY